jgi:DNA gyrase subunit A
MVAIANGKPCQLGLLEIISYYVNYQREVVLRRSKFDLERAKERAHILEGLIVAVQNIDEVIKIIKKAENTADARAKLRERFQLTEAQASAILDLRLARLTKLEVFKLEEELEELKILCDSGSRVITLI